MTMDKYISVSNTPDGNDMISCKDCLMFASPEYMYQADDIKDILNYYKSNIKIQTVSRFEIPYRNGTIQVPKIIRDDDKGYDTYYGAAALGDGTIISTYEGNSLDPGSHSNVESGCNLVWNTNESCYWLKYGSSYYENDNHL
jgi:hypothetical protein